MQNSQTQECGDENSESDEIDNNWLTSETCKLNSVMIKNKENQHVSSNNQQQRSGFKHGITSAEAHKQNKSEKL